MKLKSKTGLTLKHKPKEDDGGLYFPPNTDVETISTGCEVFNCVVGSGWALGRIVNLIGDKSTGKTLLAIEACAQFLLKFPTTGKPPRYVEPEAAFDKSYAAALGLPVERMDFADDDSVRTVEDFYNDLDKYLDSLGDDEPGMYVLDSLDALSSKAEKERAFGDPSYGDGKAKDMSKLFRMLTQKIKRKRVLVFIVSQVRDNIGVTFGAKYTRSGGKALDFYASQIVWLAQTATIKKVINKVTRVIGVAIRAKCTKNKIGTAYRECGFDIRFGFGVDDVAANVKWLADVNRLGLIGQPGLVATGTHRFLDTLEQHNDESYQMVCKKIREAVRIAWAQVEEDFKPKRKKY